MEKRIAGDCDTDRVTAVRRVIADNHRPSTRHAGGGMQWLTDQNNRVTVSSEIV